MSGDQNGTSADGYDEGGDRPPAIGEPQHEATGGGPGPAWGPPGPAGSAPGAAGSAPGAVGGGSGAAGDQADTGWSRPVPLEGGRPEPAAPAGSPYAPPGAPAGPASAPYGPAGAPYGPAGGGFHVPPMPAAPPAAPADGGRAAAVGLLNLSGLGLGYALVRRPLLTLVCWVATAVLLLVALPADPDGVPALALALYAALLLAAAAHGAAVGLRTRLRWPPRTPVALALGVLLLAVPAGGVVLYDGARDEATEQLLLDRLDGADHLVEAASEQPFDKA